MRFLIAFLILLSTFATAQQGRLEPGDEQLDSGEYVDVHTYDGRSGTSLTIELTGEFDPYLVVLDPAGEELLQLDDSEGQGVNIATTVKLLQDGVYTIGVTSATAGETGAYQLTLTGEAEAAANPLGAVQTVPTAPAWTGTFSDGNLGLELQAQEESYTGQFRIGSATYPVTAQVAGGSLSGTFESGGQRFEFSATLAGDTLTLDTGGATYTMQRQGTAPPANPLANPAPTPVPPPLAPVTQTQAEPGYITGTVFDTQGNPLPGAGVQLRGTTYGQGQYQSFETTTGSDGTYRIRVPDGLYDAKAWIDRNYNGLFFSRLLHPLSMTPNAQLDSTEGAVFDFQWKLSGLSAGSTPPGSDDTDFYGASVDFSYCGLPAAAYCDAKYERFPDYLVVPGGATIRVMLTPTAPLIDGTQGQTLSYEVAVAPQDPEYPYGTAPNPPPGYPNGGGGRTTLGADWAYHSTDLNDIPLGTYTMTVVATLPDGSTQPLKLGLSADDVEHESVTVTFEPWDDYQARSYSGGGIKQRTIYVRD